MELKELKDKYLSSLEVSEKTKKSYSQRLENIFIFLTAKKVEAVSELTTELVQEYQKQLKVGTNTRYVYLEQIKKFLDFLYQESYSFINLSEMIYLPRWERREKKELPTKKAVQTIEKVSEPEPYGSRNKAILALHLLEGLKSADISDMTIIDLDIINKELRLKRKKLFVRLRLETIQYIKKYLRQRNKLNPKQEYLFLAQGGKQLSRQILAKVLREAKR